MNIDIQNILAHCDHTLLAPEATWEDIRRICDDGIKYHTASVCIPPSFVKQAKEYVGDRLKVCTVIGFPNGYATTAAKAAEIKDALANGADECDMVINIGDLKSSRDQALYEEIRTLKKICDKKILKVIFEVCLLTDEEIVRMCEICVRAGADYVKTSTGFSKGGATPEAVALMKKTVGQRCRVKAAGGISSLEDAQHFLDLGADRLGTSRVVKLVKAME